MERRELRDVCLGEEEGREGREKRRERRKKEEEKEKGDGKKEGRRGVARSYSRHVLMCS